MASREESNVIEKESGKRNLRSKASPTKKTRAKRKSSSPKSSLTKSDELNESVGMDEEMNEAPGTADPCHIPIKVEDPSHIQIKVEDPTHIQIKVEDPTHIQIKVEENGVECMNEDFGSNGILKVKSNASGKDQSAEMNMADDVTEEKNSPSANDESVANIEDMTVIDEVMDESNEKDKDPGMDQIAADGLEMGIKEEEDFRTEPDTEMVSEDELPNESSKEPLETEAVSDEELPDPATTVDLPETEAVSEDELPPEKTDKKRKAAAAKSKGDSGATAATDGGKKKSRTSEAHKRKLLDGDTYDPSSPTSENSCDESPAAKRAALSSGGSAALPKASKTRKSLPELEKYWKAVKEDPSDFTGWTYLLQYVDQENDIDAAREAYDAFLSHYPYCYGYWRKYADYEKRKGNKEKCEE